MGVRKKILAGLAAVVSVFAFMVVLPAGKASAIYKESAESYCKNRLDGKFDGKERTCSKIKSDNAAYICGYETKGTYDSDKKTCTWPEWDKHKPYTKDGAKKLCKEWNGKFSGKTCTVKKYDKTQATECTNAGGNPKKDGKKLVCKWTEFSAPGSSSDSGGESTYGGDVKNVVGAGKNECGDGVKTSILGGGGCYTDDGEGSGVYEILLIVLNILTAGVGVLGVLGLVISGVTYLTARDNEQQVAKAKQRILQIVIGLAIFAVLYVGLQWLIPGGIFGE